MTQLFQLTAPITTTTIKQFEAEHNFKPTRDADLTEFGYAWGGHASPKPEEPEGRIAERGEPVLDGAFVTVPWVLRDKTADELEQDRQRLHRQIERKRDHRLDADFAFQDKLYQRDSKSLSRITGAATLAGFAIANGAQPGDYQWHGGTTDFEWIASDNSLTKMDAQTALAFGQVAANVETRIIFAAKALREMDPIPADYADNQYWPDTGSLG